MQIYTEQNSRANKQIRGSIANNTSWTQQSPTIVIVLQNREQKLLVRLYTIQNQPLKWQLCLYAKKTYTRAYHMHINWLKNVTEIFTKVHDTRYTQIQPLFVAISQTMTNYNSSCAYMWHRQYYARYNFKIMHCQHNPKSQWNLERTQEKELFEETSLLWVKTLLIHLARTQKNTLCLIFYHSLLVMHMWLFSWGG